MRIQAFIDFVVLLGNSVSCTLTKGILQCCQNLGSFFALSFVYLVWVVLRKVSLCSVYLLF